MSNSSALWISALQSGTLASPVSPLCMVRLPSSLSWIYILSVPFWKKEIRILAKQFMVIVLPCTDKVKINELKLAYCVSGNFKCEQGRQNRNRSHDLHSIRNGIVYIWDIWYQQFRHTFTHDLCRESSVWVIWSCSRSFRNKHFGKQCHFIRVEEDTDEASDVSVDINFISPPITFYIKSNWKSRFKWSGVSRS